MKEILNRKRTSGISLVALIVTIIVLIILTAAVIVTFMEGGIIDRAKKAVFRSDIRNYQDILLVKNAEKKIDRETGTGIEEGNQPINVTDPDDINAMRAIIPEFKEEYKGLVLIENGKLVLGPRDDAPYRGWLIDLGIEAGSGSSNGENNGGGASEAQWTLTDSDESGDISIGDLVTYNEKDTEQFYVIGISGNTVSMLAKYNLNEGGTSQDTTGEDNGCAFSSTNYWDPNDELSYPLANGKYPDLNDETTYPIPEGEKSIITIAKAYGESLEVTGRLMTVEDILALGGTDGLTENCPNFINTQSYWFGSAGFAYGESGYVYFVVGGDATVYALSYYCADNDFYFYSFDGITPNMGVRPVIEVSASSIE